MQRQRDGSGGGGQLAERWLGWAWVVSLMMVGLVATGCQDREPSSETATAPSERRAVSVSTSPSAMRFRDVTAAAGLVFQHEAGAIGKKWYPETMGAGGGFFDYDGDGLPDVLLINGRRWPGEQQAPEPTMRLYRNQGDGTFRDVTKESQLDVPLYGMGMAAADVDNDGDQDLLVTGYRQTLLFHNNGAGAFTNVTAASGIAQGGWSTAAVFVDVDRDSWLDLVIGHYVDWQPAMEEGLECTYGTPQKDYCAVTYFRGLGLQFYRNLGNGRFREMTSEVGLSAPEARVLGLSIVDANEDGWPDLIVANDLTPTLFFVNQGDGRFRERGVQAGLVLDEGGVAYAGMGIDAAHLKNDDQLCVAIGNFAGQPTTLHCQVSSQGTDRPEVFVEMSQRSGIANPTLRMVTFGLFFFDADLDGWQDLFMVNGHVAQEAQLRNIPYAQRPQLFHNRRDGAFEEVNPEAAGLALQVIGRGAAYADYDNDGDLDILLTTNQGPAYLLRNELDPTRPFLRVRAMGTQSNRDGIGARVVLHTSGRRLRDLVRTGSSYLSQRELVVTFGLLPDETIDHLKIVWPSGAVDVYREVSPNTTFVAQEGASPVSPTQPSPPTAGTAADSVLAVKRAAMAHYQAGRLEAAIEAFQRVFAKQPDDFVVQQYLVELYWRGKQWNEARRLLTSLGQTMTEANFFMQFAFHMEELQLYDLAAEIYRQAIALDPSAPEAYYRLGKNALRFGRYDAAVADFRQALERHAGLVDAILGIGIAQLEQGQMQAAEDQFQQVLQRQPDHPEAYTHLGQLYARSGRVDEAIQAYQRVIALQPERAQGYHNLGTLLVTKGLMASAIEQFEEALRRDSQYLAAHNDLGTLYAEQGDFDKAVTAFQAAVQIDPQSAPAHYNLAMAHAAKGQLAAMQQELQATLRLDPQHVEANLNLGVYALQSGHTDDALRRFQTAVHLAPEKAEAHYFLAVAYAQQGNAEAMRHALLDVVRLDTDHAQAHSALASLYYQRQQYDLAWQHATRAEQLGAPVQSLLEALKQKRGQTP